MYKLKIEILLPIYHNADENGIRNRINGDEYLKTYQDLMNQFGACTHDPNPVSGGWTNDDGDEVTDENTVYWVIYDDTKENTQFLENFKITLEERFKQDKIEMYSVSVTEF